MHKEVTVDHGELGGVTHYYRVLNIRFEDQFVVLQMKGSETVYIGKYTIRSMTVSPPVGQDEL